jgi:hypothetical protein
MLVLVGVNDALVPLVSPENEAARVYWVPTVPAKVQADTVTTPDDAVRPEQEDKVPAEAASPIAPENEVTTLPAESSALMTGSVENAAPDAAATGDVVNTS